MQAGIHDQTAHFRVSASLLQAAGEKARREGMSFSEMMRAALRRELKS
jgi:predicted DNA binding CopG/RHH family protein